MLPDFLTTALEIIIIIDVCGAIIYFTITSLGRTKDQKEELSPALQNTPSGMPALATQGASMPTRVHLSERISSPGYDPVVAKTPRQSPPKNQLPAGLKDRLKSIRRKSTYRPTPSGQPVQTQTLNTHYAELGRVLDSSKEDT